MDEMLQSVFMSEIRVQSLMAAEAFRRVEELAGDRFAGDQRRQLERNLRLWQAVHTFLASCTVISRILWPGPKAPRKQRKRGAELRHLLGLPETSPLADRFVRDGLDHIDERIDRWVPANQGKKLVGWRITGKEEPADPETVTLRKIDQDTLEVWIADVRCDLRELAREVERCTARIRIQARAGGAMAGEPPVIF